MTRLYKERNTGVLIICESEEQLNRVVKFPTNWVTE